MGKLVESLLCLLPSDLQMAFKETGTKNSSVQSAMKLIIARHLHELGFRQIVFEKPLTLSNLRGINVDVYGGEENLYIECETLPSKSEVEDRIRQLKAADPRAKFVLAVPDYMGYNAKKFESLAEVWVTCRDGVVMSPKEWVDWRRNYLWEAVDVRKLALLLKCYEEERELLAWLEEDRKALKSDFLSFVAAVASIVGGESWLPPLNCNLPMVEGIIEFGKELMEEIRAELLIEVIEVVNRLLELGAPYRLKLKRGELDVEWDPEIEEWLGGNPLTCPGNSERCRNFYRTLRAELLMLSQRIRPEIQMHMRALLEGQALAELRETVSRGDVTIRNERLLEKLGLTPL